MERVIKGFGTKASLAHISTTKKPPEASGGGGKMESEEEEEEILKELFDDYSEKIGRRRFRILSGSPGFPGRSDTLGQLGESQNVVVLLHNIGVPFQNNEDRYTWFME